MNGPSLGVAAKRAVELLDALHDDVYQLVTTLDAALLEQRWQATETNRIAHELGNGLDARSWVLKSLTRLYTRPKEANRTRHVLALEVVFAPRDFEASTVLAASVWFDKTVEPKENIWNQWRNSDRALRFLSEQKHGPAEIPKEVLKDAFMPLASRADAFAVSLCSLENAAALQEHLIEPLLSLTLSDR